MIKDLKHIPWVPVLLLCFVAVSLILHVYIIQKPCLNEDEAAQGYNTYSVLQTGFDEYGNIPIRFLSFGENKLPVAGMLSAPFITLLGLNQLSVRLPVILIGVFFPFLFYGAAFALTKSKTTALFAALFSSTNIWLQSTSRHQHEAVILAAVTLVYIRTLYKSTHANTKSTVVKLAMLLLLGLLTYHSAKVLVPFLICVTLIKVWKENRAIMRFTLIVFTVSIGVFAATEAFQPNNRVGTLSYFTSPVFVHEIQEGRRLGGSRLFYNKIVYGAYKGLERTMNYVSPTFLLFNSDDNPRFGSSQVPLLTFVEYILLLIGFIVVWVKKHASRVFLTSLLFVSILPAALALPTNSTTRSYLLTVPIIMFVSIAAEKVLQIVRKQKVIYPIIGYFLLLYLMITHIWSIGMGWSRYFGIYLKDSQTIRSWQCGTKEMADYVWEHYDEFDRFVITRAYGQPYIFLLFSKPFSPHLYQNAPKNRSYNEYGFWEQDGFDKFVFKDKVVVGSEPKTAYIITPEEARINGLEITSLKPITSCEQVRFYVRVNK